MVEVKKGGTGDTAGIVPEDVIIEYAGETGFRVRVQVSEAAEWLEVRAGVPQGSILVPLFSKFTLMTWTYSLKSDPFLRKCYK